MQHQFLLIVLTQNDGYAMVDNAKTHLKHKNVPSEKNADSKRLKFSLGFAWKQHDKRNSLSRDCVCSPGVWDCPWKIGVRSGPSSRELRRWESQNPTRREVARCAGHALFHLGGTENCIPCPRAKLCVGPHSEANFWRPKTFKTTNRRHYQCFVHDFFSERRLIYC